MPPVNAKLPDEGRQVLPLKVTVQLWVTLQVLAVVVVLVVFTFNGAQPVKGVAVNDGTGGFSIHTSCDSDEGPQLLLAVRVTV